MLTLQALRTGRASLLARLATGLIVLNSLLATPARADEPGVDHPAVARYPGAEMKHYDFKEFEQARLILSRPRKLSNGDYTADKTEIVEGQVTYLQYEIPGSASAFQVFRNYQSSLRRSGFQELFVCERPCIDGNLGDLRELLMARDLYLNYHQDIQYLAARRGNTSVSLAVNHTGSGPNGAALVWLFVIDKGSLDDAKMGITGDSPIAQALAASGKVDVYGFLFDSGKSQLKPGSDATLAELAKVLQDNPSLRIDVVGHTDNVGREDSNLALSAARAQAVNGALISRFGIAPDRLNALGRGAGQPVADNGNEEGRARNRRVEIVAQAQPATPKPNTAASRGQSPSPTSRPAPTSTPTTVMEQVDQVGNTVDKARSIGDTVRSLKDLFGR